MPSKDRKIWIIDTTLRDGEQAPGVVFQQRDKIALAEKLCSAGIDELEVGTPAMSNEERQAIRAVVAAMLKDDYTL